MTERVYNSRGRVWSFQTLTDHQPAMSEQMEPSLENVSIIGDEDLFPLKKKKPIRSKPANRPGSCGAGLAEKQQQQPETPFIGNDVSNTAAAAGRENLLLVPGRKISYGPSAGGGTAVVGGCEPDKKKKRLAKICETRVADRKQPKKPAKKNSTRSKDDDDDDDVCAENTKSIIHVELSPQSPQPSHIDEPNDNAVNHFIPQHVSQHSEVEKEIRNIEHSIGKLRRVLRIPDHADELFNMPGTTVATTDGYDDDTAHDILSLS